MRKEMEMRAPYLKRQRTIHCLDRTITVVTRRKTQLKSTNLGKHVGYNTNVIDSFGNRETSFFAVLSILEAQDLAFSSFFKKYC